MTKVGGMTSPRTPAPSARARQQGLSRTSTVTAAIGVVSLAGAGAVAAVLPGATHHSGSASGTSSASGSSGSSTGSSFGFSAGGSSSSGISGSSGGSPVATSGGS
jgi:hypothetical protein